MSVDLIVLHFYFFSLIVIFIFWSLEDYGVDHGGICEALLVGLLLNCVDCFHECLEVAVVFHLVLLQVQHELSSHLERQVFEVLYLVLNAICSVVPKFQVQLLQPFEFIFRAAGEKLPIGVLDVILINLVLVKIRLPGLLVNFEGLGSDDSEKESVFYQFIDEVVFNVLKFN